MSFWFLDPGDRNPAGVADLASLLPEEFYEEETELLMEAEIEAGVFGPALENAIRSFQVERGLIVDGRVGQDTWQALTTAPAEEEPFEDPPLE